MLEILKDMEKISNDFFNETDEMFKKWRGDKKC